MWLKIREVKEFREKKNKYDKLLFFHAKNKKKNRRKTLK